MSTVQSFLLTFFVLAIKDMVVIMHNKLPKKHFTYISNAIGVILLVIGIAKNDIALIIISCFGLVFTIIYGILRMKEDIIK